MGVLGELGRLGVWGWRVGGLEGWRPPLRRLCSTVATTALSTRNTWAVSTGKPSGPAHLAPSPPGPPAPKRKEHNMYLNGVPKGTGKGTRRGTCVPWYSPRREKRGAKGNTERYVTCSLRASERYVTRFFSILHQFFTEEQRGGKRPERKEHNMYLNGIPLGNVLPPGRGIHGDERETERYVMGTPGLAWPGPGLA